MGLLSQHAGTWIGSNAFKLGPADAPHLGRAVATVSSGAGGNVAVIAYTWSHPDEGEQDGLLALGASDQGGGVVGLWSDSWHQCPAAAVVAGRAGDAEDGVLSVGYEYAGDWRWRITVDATGPDSLRLRMDNIVPASATVDGMAPGACAAMAFSAQRPASDSKKRG